MEKLVTVEWIGEPREGVSKKTGKDWCLTDVAIKWMVEQPGRESYSQSVVGTVNKFINTEALKKVMDEKKQILVTFYVDVRYWEGKCFNNVSIYLPKDLTLDAKPL